MLVRAAPSSIPRLGAIQVDGLVLGFTLLIALLTALLFGVLPARLVVRPDLARTLREAGRGGAQRAGGNRMRRLLVVTEVALSVMLLAGAGLLIRSFTRLMSVNPGFRTEGSVSFALSLPENTYPKGERQAAFMRALMERMRALPGVQSAGAAYGMPLTSFSFNFNFEVAGRPPLKPAEQPAAEVRVATPDYFATMGIPIVKGRGLTEADRAGGQKVILITETGVQRFFPDEDPLGKHVTFGWGRGDAHLEGDIVGVVGDVKLSSLANATVPQFWAAYDQWTVSSFNVVIHSGRDPESLVQDARRAVHELDPDLAIAQVKTLDTVLAESVAQPRFYMLLLSAFAAVAMLLSAIGIYGVIAYLAGQRVREIGIRIALGASQGRVVRMIVREGTLMTLAGIGLGVLGALGLSRLLGALLFGVKPTDPVTYLAVTGGLALVALLASGIPALRAAQADPALTMRSE
jgi:putative ABC transport system permease protein